METAEAWRRKGQTVGLTNGVFDLLHEGHLSLISQARQSATRNEGSTPLWMGFCGIAEAGSGVRGHVPPGPPPGPAKIAGREESSW